MTMMVVVVVVDTLLYRSTLRARCFPLRSMGLWFLCTRKMCVLCLCECAVLGSVCSLVRLKCLLSIQLAALAHSEHGRDACTHDKRTRIGLYQGE